LPNVFAENGNVDVFRKALDQAVAFGKRCSALEKQAWTAGFKIIEECVESPAYLKVFLDVLLCGT
jgi:hypothetical protein